MRTERGCGFSHSSLKDLVENKPLADIANVIASAYEADSKSKKKELLNGKPQSKLPMSKCLEEYLAFEVSNLKGHSDRQIRKWENPKKRAINNLIKVIGDKEIMDVNRQDILDFRAWWINRIKQENLTPNSANKNFSAIKSIMSVIVDNHQLDISIDALFRRISIKNDEKTKRLPFDQDFIVTTLFGDKMSRLSEEARLLIYAMCDTGARVSELIGLEHDDIILDSDIPYIRIRPNSTRGLKTPQSERDLPLVGASLYAFNTLEGPFKRYQGKADLISTTISKYFRENNILPSSQYSLYSLRHSFEDRLTAVEPPDKVQAALMGHKYSRPRYGDGPSLAQKKAWLDKIAIQAGAFGGF